MCLTTFKAMHYKQSKYEENAKEKRKHVHTHYRTQKRLIEPPPPNKNKRSLAQGARWNHLLVGWPSQCHVSAAATSIPTLAVTRVVCLNHTKFANVISFIAIMNQPKTTPFAASNSFSNTKEKRKFGIQAVIQNHLSQNQCILETNIIQKKGLIQDHDIQPNC